ncbi:hypothetical protein L9F63_014974 [Diploptera punctata]|uniref:N-acetyltransferase domain-containing protein n=1 Tax=Diploptera punctata TaxID=6984 RepID=A0AAD8EKT4_DIPPU|nr:hypothetical protein L9F63_014974 [Diploptera punctata]
MAKWTRPKAVPFPNVWRKCRGWRETEDGKIHKFSIEDVPQDMHEDIIEFLTEFHFHPTYGSELMKNVKMYEDPTAIKQYQEKWRKALKDNISLVAFLEEEGQGDKRLIVGVNVLKVDYKDHPENFEKIESKKVRSIGQNLAYAGFLVNVYEIYGVDKLVNALGLCVHPKFRGQGLGLQITKCRFEIMKAVDLKCTLTVFVGTGTQRIALKSGFEVIAEVPSDSYKDEDGSLMYPGLECKSWIAMVKIVE